MSKAKLRQVERALHRLESTGGAPRIMVWLWFLPEQPPEPAPPELVAVYEVVQPGRASRFFADEAKALALLPGGIETLPRGQCWSLADIRPGGKRKPLPVPEDMPPGWLAEVVGRQDEEDEAEPAVSGGEA
jgi:hypothetical protein